jgi:hypothetical protein
MNAVIVRAAIRGTPYHVTRQGDSRQQVPVVVFVLDVQLGTTSHGMTGTGILG